MARLGWIVVLTVIFAGTFFFYVGRWSVPERKTKVVYVYETVEIPSEPIPKPIIAPIERGVVLMTPALEPVIIHEVSSLEIDQPVSPPKQVIKAPILLKPVIKQPEPVILEDNNTSDIPSNPYR